METKLTKLILVIKGKEIELDTEAAKELKNILLELWPEPVVRTNTIHEIIRDPRPEPWPYWGTPIYCATSDSFTLEHK